MTEEELKLQAAIEKLIEPLEQWESIKKILIEDISRSQDLINTIDRYITDRQKKFENLN
jgi:hypothetical protein